MSSDNAEAGERKILGPTTWMLYSTALFAIILVPLMTGTFYMLRLATRLFDAKNELSVIGGIFFGFVLSLIVGYIYSNKARKSVE